MCVQVPCVYLLYAASTVTKRNNCSPFASYVTHWFNVWYVFRGSCIKEASTKSADVDDDIPSRWYKNYFTRSQVVRRRTAKNLIKYCCSRQFSPLVCLFGWWGGGALGWALWTIVYRDFQTKYESRLSILYAQALYSTDFGGRVNGGGQITVEGQQRI